MLNIRNMISGHACRLRYVYRYSTSRVVHPESVAEHSYYVGFYSLMIWEWLSESDDMPEMSLGIILKKALLHDLEEARSGDFPRPFKHSSPELHALLDKASTKAFEQVAKTMFEDRDHIDQLTRSWHNAKDKSIEGRIVEFADFLAVLSFLLQEDAGAGNKTIREHVGGMVEYFDTFSGEEFRFIRPLIEQADQIMSVLFPNRAII